VERTGWTLEYIDALDFQTLHEYLQVLDGRAKGRDSFFNKRPDPPKVEE
jgi:hypothetical protein